MDATPRVVVPVARVGSFQSEVEHMYSLITARVCEFIAQRGSVSGYDVDDWLRAESELVFKPDYGLTREKRDFLVEMMLPNPDISGVAVHISPREMLVSSAADDAGKRIFRIIRFPNPIEWDGIDAEIVDGRLRVVIAIAEPDETLPLAQSA